MAPIESPAVTHLLTERLDGLVAGKESGGSQLDLIEAAAKRKEPAVQEKLKTYTASLDSKNIVSAFKVCLEGGDPEKGKIVFTGHAAGQCTKCHIINGDGGVAGPELTGVGTRQKPDYILESLVNPSAFVVPGYGLTMVTLKDNSSIAGNLLEETDKHILVKFPDPENTNKNIERKIALSDIQSRLPPISAMPPVGLLMTKYELRDLVAYLKSLKQ